MDDRRLVMAALSDDLVAFKSAVIRWARTARTDNTDLDNSAGKGPVTYCPAGRSLQACRQIKPAIDSDVVTVRLLMCLLRRMPKQPSDRRHSIIYFVWPISGVKHTGVFPEVLLRRWIAIQAASVALKLDESVVPQHLGWVTTIYLLQSIVKPLRVCLCIHTHTLMYMLFSTKNMHKMCLAG